MTKRPTETTQTLRKMREERGHTFPQMLSLLGLSSLSYCRLQEENRLHEVIQEYETLSESKAARKKTLAERLAETYALKMLCRAHLPSVGSILKRGEQTAKVLRHTGHDSVMVEWTDADGLKRRAEWTTTPHPRQTDRGVWEAKRP